VAAVTVLVVSQCDVGTVLVVSGGSGDSPDSVIV
jgi:hypothetical protein